MHDSVLGFLKSEMKKGKVLAFVYVLTQKEVGLEEEVTVSIFISL